MWQTLMRFRRKLKRNFAAVHLAAGAEWLFGVKHTPIEKIQASSCGIIREKAARARRCMEALIYFTACME